MRLGENNVLLTRPEVLRIHLAKRYNIEHSAAHAALQLLTFRKELKCAILASTCIYCNKGDSDAFHKSEPYTRK